LVLKSLTKLFAIPGLRLGYLAGNESILDRLRKAEQPWTVNSLAQQAGLFLLDQTDYIAQTPQVTAQARAYLYETLAPYFDVLPSDCNFVMARLKSPKAVSNNIGVNDDNLKPSKVPTFSRLDNDEIKFIRRQKKKLLDFLFQRGILVRDLANIEKLSDLYLRFAVRPKEETLILQNALNDFMSHYEKKFL
jgi:threonine-phosphate decarboxylase